MLRWLLFKLPFRVIGRVGQTVYLVRGYLLGGRKGLCGRLPFALYLHRFMASDAATELHNHPWKWSLSLVLKGGYFEDRWVGVEGDGVVAKVERREVKPGRLNFIRHSTFHRVDLREREAWTLFLAGPRIQDWGFIDRNDFTRYTPWKEYPGAE